MSLPVQSRTDRFCMTVVVTVAPQFAVILLSMDSRVMEKRNGAIKSTTAVHNKNIVQIQGFDIGGGFKGYWQLFICSLMKTDHYPYEDT